MLDLNLMLVLRHCFHWRQLFEKIYVCNYGR